MTAKTTHRRAFTRPVVLAGLVTASTAAISLPFAPHAAADSGHPGPSNNAENDSAVAVTLNDTHQQGKAPTTGDDAQRQDPRTQPGTDTKRADTKRADAKGADAKGEQKDTQQGRGAQYRADGTLVVVSPEEQPEPKPASPQQIDRWIDQALKVMDTHDIPGSYQGIHKNLMRESGGDPQTINLWDTNAQQNIPSKGLLQVIDPTFEQYHVKGTEKDPFDPVANIVAASNYAADRYGSIDNVNSAY